MIIEDKKAFKNYKHKLISIDCKIILPVDLSLKKNVIKIPFVRLVGLKLFGFYLSRFFYTWGGTVTYLALQIANRMGAKEIHLCGVDMYVEKSHYKNNYYHKDKEWNIPDVQRMIRFMEWIIIRFQKKGIKITSESEYFNYLGVNQKK